MIPLPKGARATLSCPSRGTRAAKKTWHENRTVTRNAAGGNPALTANRTYQGTRDALHKIEKKAGCTVFSSYTYDVNPISQRTSVTYHGIWGLTIRQKSSG